VRALAELRREFALPAGRASEISLDDARDLSEPMAPSIPKPAFPPRRRAHRSNTRSPKSFASRLRLQAFLTVF